MGAQRLDQARREKRQTVLSALAIVDADRAALEIDVADAEVAAFADAQAGAVHERRGKAVRLGEPLEDCVALRSAQIKTTGTRWAGRGRRNSPKAAGSRPSTSR